MADVTLEINDRKYRMSCEDGQEHHLIELGRRFNIFVDGFKDEFGEIGDNRLTVMAGIAVMDNVVELENSLKQLKAELAKLNEEEGALAQEKEKQEKDFAKRMNEVAQKLELVTSALSQSKS